MTDILDISKILSDYSKELQDDFGFSAVSEEEYNSAISESEKTVDFYKKKLSEVEKLVVPFFMKLLNTADKEYIYWPNRKPAIEDQIKKILLVTRS
jgi:hypothetical protein